ncbi:MAG: insulinase family protein [Bacteroidia bacterium]|nr:insulinase family protein [Bacteroidia bacterium]
MEDYILHQLDNGLRIAYKEFQGTSITHIGFTIDAGSRDDGILPGTAHCFEHMLFKGTSKRNAYNIINRLEIVGGEMNAFTTKEITVIYASIINEFSERALELLGDLCFNSNFPEKELEKEKKVIAEEINMYLDTPEENIFDEFQELVFAGHSLAPNILGTTQTLNQITSEDLRTFHQRFYHPENIVLSISSAVPFKQFIKWAEKHIKIEKKSFTPIKRPSFKVYAEKKETKNTDHLQCHAILGSICYPHKHPNRLAMLLLNNLLGGPGMNSRLNLSVREKYGYTYNVESGYTSFRDTGLFHCYLSTDKKNLDKAVNLVWKELKKLKEKPLTAMQLSHAKMQFNGQIAMGEENRQNIMLMLGKNIVQGYKIESLKEVMNKINEISALQLQQIANEIFDLDKMSYLAYVSD